MQLSTYNSDFGFLIALGFVFLSCKVTQIASQPQVQAELTLRLTQLQTRLASLKIENEEVRHTRNQREFTFTREVKISVEEEGIRE